MSDKLNEKVREWMTESMLQCVTQSKWITILISQWASKRDGEWVIH